METDITGPFHVVNRLGRAVLAPPSFLIFGEAKWMDGQEGIRVRS